MNKKPGLEMFHFEYNIRCADNGVLFEFPDLIEYDHADNSTSKATLMKTVVATSKQDILDLIKAQLDKIYD